MNRRILVLTMIAVVAMFAKAYGAAVLWDAFEQRDIDNGWAFEVGWDVRGMDGPSGSALHYGWIELGVAVSSRQSGASVTLSVENLTPNLASIVGWMQVMPGDILDASTTHAWAAEGWSTPEMCGKGITGEIQASPGESVYLALFQSYYESESLNDAFGWVELAVDATGDVSLMRSALAFPGDGVSLRVGSSIPEPSSGILLLLGLGVLALRRRRTGRLV